MAVTHQSRITGDRRVKRCDTGWGQDVCGLQALKQREYFTHIRESLSESGLCKVPTMTAGGEGALVRV